MEDGSEDEKDDNDRDGTNEEDLFRTQRLVAMLHPPGFSGTLSVLDGSLYDMTGDILVSSTTLFAAIRLIPLAPLAILKYQIKYCASAKDICIS